MISQYHILNGDALKEQFPARISGEIIVCRECLVDGPVDEESEVDLFEARANFIEKSNEGFSKEGYYENVVSQFKLIQAIPAKSEINLWFEDDLFCQVNFWFVCSLLKDHSKNCSINLVRPREIHPYNFGMFDKEVLISLYDERKPLNVIDTLADLWRYYQKGKTKRMLKVGREFVGDLPFLLPAIQAHIDRISSNGNLSRPTESLIKIKKELKTDDFGKIFREFSKREAIYGFGDLQVKRLLDELSE
ncbi:MAG: DUF1835 domain-containing protein [Bacteroidetes bacterium]|jgi:hypothetical protein|nr:DUF1835 domain-containing protein [Bacteroidota bacterium]